MGFRLACGYILRELFRNRQILIDFIINDNLSMDTVSEFLDSENK